MLQEVLRGAVIERLGTEALHLGRRLVRIGGTDETPVAEFDDGDVDADLIVAADGIHSAARAQRYPDEGSFLWNGSLLWRGIAELEPVLDGRSMIWAGHPEQKFVGYPIADLPGGMQRFNFIAELRRPESDLARSEDWNRSGSLDDFLPQFKGWDFGWLNVPGIVEAAPETFLFPMVDREPIPQWTFGRSTLLGDAAHPMYPIGSNGASQAILDARVLAGCLRRHGMDIEEALRRYEAARRPATTAIVQANRGLGPELPMQLVEERAPDGFADIADVITPEEIAEVTERYRRRRASPSLHSRAACRWSRTPTRSDRGPPPKGWVGKMVRSRRPLGTLVARWEKMRRWGRSTGMMRTEVMPQRLAARSVFPVGSPS